MDNPAFEFPEDQFYFMPVCDYCDFDEDEEDENMGTPNPTNYAKEYEDLDYENKDCGVDCNNHCDECPYKTEENKNN